jgi:hypothetical protein
MSLARILPVAAVLALVGLTPACSSSPPPPADTFVNATVAPGPKAPNTVCGLGSQQQWLEIGTPAGQKPVTVNDGDSQGAYGVQVACTVSPQGDGFNIALNATLGGPNGGSINVTGHVLSSGTSTGITVSFQKGSFGTFRETDCTLDFSYNGNKVPVDPPITAGRIWAHVACPTAASTTGSMTGGQLTTCDGEADFLFEQCGQ